MVNKKIVIICSVITLVIVVLIVGWQIKKFKETSYASEEEKQSMSQNQNSAQNENLIEQNKSNTENTIDETQNQVIGAEETKPGEKEEEIPEKQDNKNDKDINKDTNKKNSKEQALKLVEKEWGEDDTVYFTVDNQSKNIYNISVRSKDTTETLAEYEVNVDEETVIIK